ncbi:SCP2 sterol-binding domain-containing protein [Sphingosinicella humi]|uniref:Sterol-binding protein n=1 Tax=Allosphingosinicella humi TaxID=2068657 RepID=A0A2U2IZD9_9SPHN|nr:SCP2 sterol-binding domain-containing protein [Sphingosinicella humi]PWG01452.1 sterol-binding protein [Sphingosinicella humi]
MTKTDLVAKMGEHNAFVPGKRIKLDFGGSEGAIMLDGVANAVTEEDGAADTTIKISWADWEALTKGQLDAMTAFMQGKLKVEGDMSNAMQLQGVLTKLKA